MFVDFGVEIFRDFAVGLGRNYVDGPLFPDHFPDPVGVIGLVRNDVLTGLQAVQKLLAGRGIMGLSRRQFKPDRQAVLIGKCMNFRA